MIHVPQHLSTFSVTMQYWLLGSQSSLRKLSIASYADACRTLLPALYHFQELDIQFHHVRMGHISPEELSSEYPALERLSLYCDYGTESALIHKIRLLPMLITLSISRCSASDTCLLSLLSEQLQSQEYTIQDYKTISRSY